MISIRTGSTLPPFANPTNPFNGANPNLNAYNSSLLIGDSGHPYSSNC